MTQRTQPATDAGAVSEPRHTRFNTTSHERPIHMTTTLFLDHRQPEWFATARCNDGVGTLASLFFSEDLSEIARAKAICGLCQSHEECLNAAVGRREPWGVWGGELLMNGRILAARKRRGRPPKVARPEFVIDELGQIIDEVVCA